ncbi:MAG: PAS domain S-box protein [Chryseobacterium sp.]|nr:MAG: PAS domain S-box protein [Chryseobacterium sp.]
MNPTEYLGNEQLLEILAHTKTATAVHTGELATIRFANQAMLDIWGRDSSVIGKTLEQALPELKGQPFIDMFAKVFREGLTIQGTDTPADLTVNGSTSTYYFDFEYRAMKDSSGKTICVLHTATDVTERFLKQEAEKRNAQAQDSLAREQALNQALATTNEELRNANEQLRLTKNSLRQLNEQLEQRVQERVDTVASLNSKLEVSNQELEAVNEELKKSNRELVDTYRKLKLSRDETALAISAAGLATFDLDPLTCQLSGNEQLKHWFGLENSEQIDLSKATGVIAEEDREKIIEAITWALDPASGGDYNTLYAINGPAGSEQRIVQAKGKTIFNEQGSPIRLSGVLLDVTDQLQHSMEIQEANTRLNIAIEAGSLGSTEVDLATGKMECNAQFKKCYGRAEDEDFSYPELFEAMLPKYRETVRSLVARARENRSIYQAEYEVMWPDGSIHWISAHGRARYDGSGKSIKMVGIISDITEAKADEQRKNDFIAMVSHELKTPLTSINGYVQLLHRKAEKSGDDFTAQALDKTINQLKKMTGMVNSFLNVSRLESGKIQVEKQEFDLNELLREMESELGFSPHDHQLVFQPAALPMVNADRDKIGHVLSNLISNAMKYSPSGSKITISCKSNEREIQVAVADQGNGISEQDKPFIFDRYYRVSDQPTSISGFGIGLYLCAEIIQRHKGRIWVESELGHGSTFSFSLPLSSSDQI